jgi:hypothetical protein
MMHTEEDEALIAVANIPAGQREQNTKFVQVAASKKKIIWTRLNYYQHQTVLVCVVLVDSSALTLALLQSFPSPSRFMSRQETSQQFP